MNERDVLAQPPLEPAQVGHLTGPVEVAAGLPAVLSSARFAVMGPGPKKAVTLLRTLNQKGGIDCTSCAWPEPDEHRSMAEFCENGVKAISDEATRKRLKAEFFARHSVEQLSRQSDYWLNQQGRLVEPLYLARDSSHYRPISWDDAFTLLGQRLRSLSEVGRAVFYTSGRTSNEAAFLYQLMVRRFGTNNLPDCANLCHESSGVGLGETVGAGKGTITLDDLHGAELILVVGQNPGTNHPRMLTALEKAKKRGARLVSINPLAEAALVRFKNPQDFLNPIQGIQTLLGSGTQMSDLHLPVRINGDVALLEVVCRRLIQRGAVDRNFIESRTSGFEELVAHLESLDEERCLAQCGLSSAQVEPLVEMLAGAERIVFCWAMGLTQHVNAVDNIRAIVNLCLLRGAIGKPGAGLCPVRGHSNVQGDRTMGITNAPKSAFLDRLGSHFGFEPPRQAGLDTVGSIEAMQKGEVDVLVCLGGNFLSATPDTEATARALRRVGLTVQISTKLNRSHLITGEEALILPCLGRSELDRNPQGVAQFVTVENSMSIVHRSQGRLEPAGPLLRSEVSIVCGLASVLLATDWSIYARDYDRIRQEIEACIPGFENYNQRVRQDAGFRLPSAPGQGQFPTRDGRAQFSVLSLPDLVLAAGEYWMMTIRTHDQFNTTVYGLDDRYRGIMGQRRVILMSPLDMERERLRTGDRVDLLSGPRVGEDFRVVGYPIPEGCTATYFPESNVLVPLQEVARGSRTPAYKSVRIRIRRRT